MNLEAIESIKEAKNEIKKIKGGVSADVIFMAKCSILFLTELQKSRELLENLTELKRLKTIENSLFILERKKVKSKTKREPSVWQSMVGKYLKEGKTIIQASKDYKKLVFKENEAKK